jgi:hypothetical protein
LEKGVDLMAMNWGWRAPWSSQLSEKRKCLSSGFREDNSQMSLVACFKGRHNIIPVFNDLFPKTKVRRR